MPFSTKSFTPIFCFNICLLLPYYFIWRQKYGSHCTTGEEMDLKIFCLLDNPLFTITMLYFSDAENLKSYATKTVEESTVVRIQTDKRLITL
jgi:hypothetical protein